MQVYPPATQPFYQAVHGLTQPNRHHKAGCAPISTPDHWHGHYEATLGQQLYSHQAQCSQTIELLHNTMISFSVGLCIIQQNSFAWTDWTDCGGRI